MTERDVVAEVKAALESVDQWRRSEDWLTLTPDAQRIVNATVGEHWLRALFERCEQAEQERDRLKADLDEERSTFTALAEHHVATELECDRLKAEVERLAAELTEMATKSCDVCEEVEQTRDGWMAENARLSENLQAEREAHARVVTLWHEETDSLKESLRRSEAKNERLTASVKRWEDEEITRAMDCCGQEERAQKAEAELAALKAENKAMWDAGYAFGVDMEKAAHDQNVEAAFSAGCEACLRMAIELLVGTHTTHLEDALVHFKASRKGGSDA